MLLLSTQRYIVFLDIKRAGSLRVSSHAAWSPWHHCQIQCESHGIELGSCYLSGNAV